jgi:hypothetical protein
MKNILLIISLFITTSLFSLDYRVLEVTGKVEREVSKDTWKDIVVGDILSDSIRIKTGFNSKLVFEDIFTKKYAISSFKNDLLQNLVLPSVVIGGPVITSDATNQPHKSTNISTSATRASDANEDLEWAE